MKNIILLPGALGGSDQFLEIKKNLENIFRVFLFDYSGHCNKVYHNKFSIALFAEELKEFIEENKIEKPLVFAYSMGGYVTLRLITSNPGNVAGLICLGTKFEWSKESAEKEIQNLIPETIERKVPAFAKVLTERHGENNWKKVLEETASLMTQLGHNNEISNYALEEINIPVWLGRGNSDKMVNREETLKIQTRIKNSSYYELPDTKHPIENVSTTMLCSIIKTFAEKHLP